MLTYKIDFSDFLHTTNVRTIEISKYCSLIDQTISTVISVKKLYQSFIVEQYYLTEFLRVSKFLDS